MFAQKAFDSLDKGFFFNKWFWYSVAEFGEGGLCGGDQPSPSQGTAPEDHVLPRPQVAMQGRAGQDSN